MRRGIAGALLLAGTVLATELDLRLPGDASATRPSPNCASVVVRRCEASAPELSAAGYRELQQRRSASNLDHLLEAVVIEGERLRRPPTVAEALEAATAVRTARSFEDGDGGQCTCVKPCPPWPLACCSCTKGGRDAMIHNLIK